MNNGIIFKGTKRTSLIHPVIAAALALSFLTACATTHGVISPADLQAKYESAVEDARVAEYDEISYDLVPIVEANEYLIWKGEGEDAKVLMVTWTSWNGYDDLVGKSMKTTRDIWVTPVPQLIDFIRDHAVGKKDFTLRIEQLLGLPAGNGKNRFVEIWVNPKDLFRPSPDPEITDREAGLDFPVSEKFIEVRRNYIWWFNDLKAVSYGKDGYPWTRLGYTYDWGDPKNEVGLSEFVISPGAEVEIEAVYHDLDYFN